MELANLTVPFLQVLGIMLGAEVLACVGFYVITNDSFQAVMERFKRNVLVYAQISVYFMVLALLNQ